jgi:hypothetical protein
MIALIKQRRAPSSKLIKKLRASSNIEVGSGAFASASYAPARCCGFINKFLFREDIASASHHASYLPRENGTTRVVRFVVGREMHLAFRLECVQDAQKSWIDVTGCREARVEFFIFHPRRNWLFTFALSLNDNNVDLYRVSPEVAKRSF